MMQRAYSQVFLFVAVTGCLAACTTVPPVEESQTVAISQERLIGEWTLTRVGRQTVERRMTLGFRNDGIMIGSLRCNSMSGRYVIESTSVVFPDSVIITAAGCGRTWRETQSQSTTAEDIVYRVPPPVWRMSEDGTQLYVFGSKTLTFARTE